ncbi:hypothetical protein [Streptomyces sp. NPDC051567]|uniref:hypothetical protein n=1 Tax=Streptomyces sp. NPDC051567 TaxID=3365660 RepID=UPI0037B374E2
MQRTRAAWAGGLVAAALAAGVLVAPAAQATGNPFTKPGAEQPGSRGPAAPVFKSSAQPHGKGDARAKAESAAGAGARALNEEPTDLALRPGEKLLSGTYIDSKNVWLSMQADGNLVLVHQAGGVLWSADTWGNPGAYLHFQKDGNLVLYKKDGGEGKGGALWNSGTWGLPDTSLRLQSDGNLVLYRFNNTPAWATATWMVDNVLDGGENLAPGQWTWADNAIMAMESQGWFTVRDRDTGAARLYTDIYSPGAYARMQTDGNFVIYKKDGGEGRGGALDHTSTWGNPGARLVFERNGNLVMYKADDSVLLDFGTGDAV